MRKFLLLLSLVLLLSACGSREPEIIDTGEPGHIRVLVFHDKNRNRVFDPDEQGVVDMVSVVQGERCPTGKPREELFITQTSPEGISLYSNLEPGKYCVSYIRGTNTTTRITYWVYLNSGETIDVPFGLMGN